ncbi:acyl-ACP--UDP-N-acetylglucosamine O-acyltransferase [Ilyobacter polytropus]|uniref:Acyl-[acyl-carrier-protein]--UDP-N-acetylglucosamine O-acyltransferase n=1 Tax=Ilyobacter polytropus (strain ATCC 51220 / DSM 2926 / LMG 16218 / CuHBu1) TaxID=572544 RepID=E3H7U2_ILYPC|nr:acyl-ACP--UDP-N-acetylglucosamine O-acyltransferase [Ilyobacter polytropus]ADO82894.1 acyl-(acyl-carrier-protein)--UDP-N-acetylglucosamine O-acyltransferase [Ilyobacter polytropus DSM 2926]
MVEIHETAIIAEGAVLEDGVKIGPYCVIGKDVKIGKNTLLESHVVIEGITEIGEGNKIHSFASIGKDSQDLKYKGEPTKTIIGNNNKIREFVTIHRGTTDRWETRVGDNNLIMAYVHIAHDVIVGDNCIFSNNATLAGHVTVDSNALVGGLTPVHQFCRIGSYSMTGGASAINQDICPFVLAEGNKAKVRGLNSVGLRRRGFSNEEISNLKKAYKLIFRSGMPLKEAVEELKATYGEDKNVMYLVDFIEKSDRGIAR